MLINFQKRILWGVGFALLLSFMTITVSLAATPHNEIASPDDCLECHEDTVTTWQDSMHGQAMSDTAFQQAWQAEGEPRECLRCHTTGFDAATGTFEAEGITCSACHYIGPNSSSHPEQIMFTKDSAESCGECHLETLAEWEASAHGENNMTCANCHNPHANSIKQENMETLCQTCHTNEGYFYGMTTHAEAGLLCTDCHLRVSDAPMGEGHAKRHHTFAVDLETCNACHAEGMHYPEDNMQAAGLATDNSTGGGETQSIETQMLGLTPTSTSPFNFALLAAVIGLAFGFVGSPLFERWFRQTS
ncbi:MAG: hypothetical protein KC419_01135 [Anaerolineales bacterium]|nr:hypothetical protein [Anaerolineales bacterium]